MVAKIPNKKKSAQAESLFNESRPHEAVGIPTAKPTVAEIFNDPESRRNIVGLFDRLLKMDQRNNPELYGLKKKKRDP